MDSESHQMHTGLPFLTFFFPCRDLLITPNAKTTHNCRAGNWGCEDLNAACHPPVCSVQFHSLELDLLSHSGTRFSHSPYLSFAEPKSHALKSTATKVCFKHFYYYYYWSVYRLWRLINCNNPLERILHFIFNKKVRLLKSPNAASS